MLPVYLWDWSLCDDKAARFENMVASHLLKHCHFIEDTEGEDMALTFVRAIICLSHYVLTAKNAKKRQEK